MFTDLEGGIQINKFLYFRPVWIFDVLKAEIVNHYKKVKELKDQYVQERMKILG